MDLFSLKQKQQSLNDEWFIDFMHNVHDCFWSQHIDMTIAAFSMQEAHTHFRVIIISHFSFLPTQHGTSNINREEWIEFNCMAALGINYL